MKLLAWLFVAFLFMLPLVVYRRWYPRAFTVIRLDTDLNSSFSSVRPSKAFYRSFDLGLGHGFVTLGNGYVALYVPSASDSCFYYGPSVSFCSDVIIFRKSRLGRLKSVDLSDRCLVDILSKFKKEV